MIKSLVLQENEVVSQIEVKYNENLDQPTFIMMTENDNKCVIALTIEQTEQLINTLTEILIKTTSRITQV